MLSNVPSSAGLQNNISHFSFWLTIFKHQIHKDTMDNGKTFRAENICTFSKTLQNLHLTAEGSIQFLAGGRIGQT